MNSDDVRQDYETLRKRIEELHKSSLSGTGQTAVMFCDLASSTAYKSQREQVSSLLKTYRHNSEIQTQVKRFNGQVVKNLGDGILAVFKIDEPDDAALPLNAAIRIQKHFDAQNTNLSEDEQIHSRIGVAAGYVVDFNVLNAEGERVSDPQGSTVDKAARLCSLAKPCQIICDSTIISLLTKASIHFDILGPLKASLKGFRSGQQVHIVKWGDGAPTDLAEPAPIYQPIGFLTTEFVLHAVEESQCIFRVVGHSHRHFCDNVELYNIVASKIATNNQYRFKLVFLNPFSPFKSYSELITRRRVADLKPSILQNIVSACRLFKDLSANVEIIAAHYPMAIPLVQADDTLYCSFPFKSMHADARREGVVGGPYFEVKTDTDLGGRLVRHFESDPHTAIPIMDAVEGRINVEDLLATAVK